MSSSEILESLGRASLVEIALRTTLVFGLAFGCAWLLRRRSAAARHLLWTSTLASALLIPAIVGSGFDLDLPVLPPTVSEFAIPGAKLAPPPVPATNDAGLTPSGMSTRTAATGSDTRSKTASTSPAEWLTTLVIAVAGAMLAYLLLGLVRIAWITRSAESLSDDSSWKTLQRTLEQAAGVPRPVELRITPAILAPATWGAVRPVILLPADARGWPTARRRNVLIHELAHIRRFDWLSKLAAHLVCAVFWFHPLAWLAARLAQLEAERACDDDVVRAGGSAPAYAEQLLDLARRARSARPNLAVAMAQCSHLSTRIDSILQTGRRRTPMKRAQILFAAVAAVTGTTTVGALRLAHAAAAEDPSTAPVLAASQLTEVSSEPALPADAVAPGESRSLHRTAAAGYVDRVRELLDQGVDVNAVREPRGYRGGPRTALGAAAKHGHSEVVSLLLARGARADFAPRGDATPLMLAAANGHREIVGILLHAGANAGRVIDGDGSPLMSAASSGDLVILDSLIAEGADPNRTVAGDGSPLIAAVRSGHLAAVERLLVAGADPNLFVDGDESPMYHAAVRGDRAMIELLIGFGGDPDQEIPGDGTALIVAARRGHRELVRRLIESGTDIDKGVEGDGNPLIMAAGSGNLGVVRMLVEAGADVNRFVPGDETPVIKAAEGGHLQVVEFLIERGADIQARVPGGNGRNDIRTALRAARRGGHRDVVELLRRHGASE